MKHASRIPHMEKTVIRTGGVSGMQFIIFWISAHYYAIIAYIGMHVQHDFRTAPMLKSHEAKEEAGSFPAVSPATDGVCRLFTA